MIAQCAGATLAAFWLLWLLGPVAYVGATLPVLDTTQSFSVECFYSGILALVVSGWS